MKIKNFRDMLALIFIPLSFLSIAGGVVLIATHTVSEIAGNIIAGAIGSLFPLITLIIQFYFRKSASEKEGTK